MAKKSTKIVGGVKGGGRKGHIRKGGGGGDIGNKVGGKGGFEK